jgi:undecaprenyl-diphosphatase
MPDATAPPPEPLDAPQRRRAGVRFDLLALAGFGAVFAAVQLNRTAAFDLAITLRIQARRSPGVARLMETVSWPGFPPESRVIPPSIAVFLWLRRYRLEAVFQAAAWGTALLSTAVKEVTRRQRPLPPDVQVVVANLGGSSFPSGHVLTYVGVYGFAAHLANSLIRPRWLRAMVVAPLVGLIALIGASRIYLGHHWPTDVLASYLLGIASLLGLTALYERLKRRETGA